MKMLASSTNPGTVNFTWTDNSGDGNSLATDKSMLVVYNPIKNETVTIKAGVARAVGKTSVMVPASYSGDSVHTYIAFTSEDGQLVSNSEHAGEVAVA